MRLVEQYQAVVPQKPGVHRLHAVRNAVAAKQQPRTNLVHGRTENDRLSRRPRPVMLQRHPSTETLRHERRFIVAGQALQSGGNFSNDHPAPLGNCKRPGKRTPLAIRLLARLAAFVSTTDARRRVRSPPGAGSAARLTAFVGCTDRMGQCTFDPACAGIGVVHDEPSIDDQRDPKCGLARIVPSQRQMKHGGVQHGCLAGACRQIQHVRPFVGLR